MSRLSLAIPVFAVAFAVVFISPPLLGQPFSLYPLMKMGDAVDLLSPLVLIPLYWALFQLGSKKPPSMAASLVFAFLAALWVEGQGMHLSANSIGHHLKTMNASDASALTGFYDEVLSHYLWHLGVMGFSVLLMVRQWRQPLADEQPEWRLASAAGLIYGFAYFAIVVEGQTGLLGVPFAALAALLGLSVGRKRLRQQPLLTFFVVSYWVAVIFFVAWAAYWQGLPEFSQVGIID